MSGLGSAATIGVAGCSGDGGQSTDNSGDEPLSSDSNVDFEIYAFVPVLMKESGKAISPVYEFGELHNSWAMYNNPDFIAIPDKKAVEDELYRPELPFILYLNANEKMSDVESVNIRFSPSIPEGHAHAQVDSQSASYRFAPEEIIGGKYVKSREMSDPDTDPEEGAAIDLKYDAYTATAGSLRAAKLDISVEVVGGGRGGTIGKTETVFFGVPNNGSSGAKELIEATGATWDAGRAVAGKAAGGKGGGPLYKSTKLTTAIGSGTINEELTRDAVVKDTAAFGELLSEKTIDLGDRWTGGVGSGGAAFVGSLSAGVDGEVAATEADSRTTETDSRTTETDSRTEEPAATEGSAIDGLNFSIEMAPGQYNLQVLYKDSGTDTYPVSEFKLDLDINGVTGEYPLSRITNDEMIEPGESYKLNKETLGVDSELIYYNGGEATLFYNLNGEWAPVVEVVW